METLDWFNSFKKKEEPQVEQPEVVIQVEKEVVVPEEISKENIMEKVYSLSMLLMIEASDNVFGGKEADKEKMAKYIKELNEVFGEEK